MGRHKIDQPAKCVDRDLLPASVTPTTVAVALREAKWECTTRFVAQVMQGHSKALTALGDAIRAETAAQAGMTEAEIWKVNK